ncbi:TetR/AcrR family transcriptional regulator [Geodermatophilus nigrescens]
MEAGGPHGGRRARTRERIRTSAQRLFDERGFARVTMIDIARDAGVATQTIFNNFAGKEDLFFADRTPWLDGPAQAVRGRPRGTDPLTALRDHLVASVRDYCLARSGEDRARFLRVVEESPALLAYERVLTFEAEARLRSALTESFAEDGDHLGGPAAAALVAAAWLAVTRSMLAVEHHIADSAVDPIPLADGITAICQEVLQALRTALATHLPPARAASDRPVTAVLTTVIDDVRGAAASSPRVAEDLAEQP